MKLWQLIEMESRAVEIATGAICCAIATGALLGAADWIGSPWVAGVWMAVSGLHCYVATTRLYALRQAYAALSVLIFGVLAYALGTQYGLERPAAPAFLMSALVQCWVFFAVESDRVDARNRARRSV